MAESQVRKKAEEWFEDIVESCLASVKQNKVKKEKKELMKAFTQSLAEAGYTVSRQMTLQSMAKLLWVAETSLTEKRRNWAEVRDDKLANRTERGQARADLNKSDEQHRDLVKLSIAACALCAKNRGASRQLPGGGAEKSPLPLGEYATPTAPPLYTPKHSSETAPSSVQYPPLPDNVHMQAPQLVLQGVMDVTHRPTPTMEEGEIKAIVESLQKQPQQAGGVTEVDIMGPGATAAQALGNIQTALNHLGQQMQEQQTANAEYQQRIAQELEQGRTDTEEKLKDFTEKITQLKLDPIPTQPKQILPKTIEDCWSLSSGKGKNPFCTDEELADLKTLQKHKRRLWEEGKLNLTCEGPSTRTRSKIKKGSDNESDTEEEDELQKIQSKVDKKASKAGAIYSVYPLVEAPRAVGDPLRHQYQPFQTQEIEMLKQKMPPLETGGNAWLSSFLTHTSHHTLSVGDLRGVLSQCCKPHMMRELFEQADMANAQNLEPLALYMDGLRLAIHALFPPPTPTAPSFKFFQSGTSASQYYDECLEEHIKQMGVSPLREMTQCTLFHQAVVDKLPQEVAQKLKDVPGLLADAVNFVVHLKHHIDTHNTEHAKNRNKTTDMQEELLKLQLAQARATATKQKQDFKTKPTKQLTAVETTASDTPNMQMYQSTRGNFSGRGGGRGRGRGRGSQGNQYNDNVCFNCGKPGHWARDCRSNPQNQNQWYYQQQYPAPYQHQPQQYQAPPQQGQRGGMAPPPWQQAPRGRGGPPRGGYQGQYYADGGDHHGLLPYGYDDNGSM